MSKSKYMFMFIVFNLFILFWFMSKSKYCQHLATGENLLSLVTHKVLGYSLMLALVVLGIARWLISSYC